MKIILGIVVLVLFIACSESEEKVKDLRTSDSELDPELSEDQITPDNIEQKLDSISASVKKNPSEWTHKVVLISEKNWGYQLFQNGTMKINQTSIPSIQGIAGFDSQEKAERTAKHILKKLNNGIFPPTVNKEELDSLDVLRD